MRTIAAMFVFALALGPSTAFAWRCSRGRAGVPLPVALTVGPSDFGLTPAACSDARVGLDLRAGAVIDTPDFYGALGAEAVLTGTVPLGGRLWLSGGLSALRYRFAQNATVISTGFSLGPSDVGLHVGLIKSDTLRVTTYVRVRLPTESGTQYTARAGLEPGLSVLWTPSRRWSIMGGASVPVEFAFLGGRGLSYGSVRGSLDASVLLGGWFEPVLGAELRVGNDPAGALEYVAPRLSLRFHPGRAVAIHLSGVMPLGGIERTLFRASLGFWIGW